MQKITLQNRKGQNIVGILTKPTGDVKGVCVVMHGYGGFKEQSWMVAMADVFREHGFITFNFDATNSTGEGDGKYEDARVGLHYEDLEDVVKWAKEQDWFTGQLALTGHSMGGFAVARYAEKHPEEVAYLAPIAPLVSGDLFFEARERFMPEAVKAWQETGWYEKTSPSKPGFIYRSPWDFVVEAKQHDLIPEADRLTMSTLVVVGENDESIPPDNVKKFFDAIPAGQKDLAIMKDTRHTYRTSEQLADLKTIISNWLEKVLK